MRPIIEGTALETGCPAIDLAWVAAGKMDAFISDPIDFAEIAAGDLLVREAGGKIKVDLERIGDGGEHQLQSGEGAGICIGGVHKDRQRIGDQYLAGQSGKKPGHAEAAA